MEPSPPASIFTPVESHALNGGVQYVYQFPNGYGASVIQGPYSYGGLEGRWEIGILKNDELCYDSGITDDVLGWLSDAQAAEILIKIAALTND